MPDREKVIALLERYVDIPNVAGVENYGAKIVYMPAPLITDTLALLKAQKEATIEPKRIDLEEETKAWLDEMDAVEALGNIANICQDWDGYRTADGLGGLVNEIWAYARYCADRIAKAQEAVEPSTLYNLSICPVCKNALFRGQKFCHECGKRIEWEGR